MFTYLQSISCHTVASFPVINEAFDHFHFVFISQLSLFSSIWFFILAYILSYACIILNFFVRKRYPGLGLNSIILAVFGATIFMNWYKISNHILIWHTSEHIFLCIRFTSFCHQLSQPLLIIFQIRYCFFYFQIKSSVLVLVFYFWSFYHF